MTRLAPGDYFGRAACSPAPARRERLRALTRVVGYEVGQAALAKLMDDRPSIADEISVTLSQRRGPGTSVGQESHGTNLGSVSGLVARIRQLFDLPHV
jgi:hypothetical protein